MQPYRSWLFVPGHREGWAAKGAMAGADALILDLEDSVPEGLKARAREMLPDAIEAARSSRPGIGLVVRVNPWSSPHAPADYAAASALPVDAVMVPKVETRGQLERIDAVLEYLERDLARDEPLELVATLETAHGIAERDSIAGSPRVAAVMASTTKNGDVARSIGFTWTPEGPETLYLRSGVVIACRAVANCQPIVGVWQDLRDLDGLERSSVANRGLGFQGEVVIHPSHVEVVNRVYSPDEEQLRYYRELIASHEAAVTEGRGATAYAGEHIDLAHVATARAMVAWADRIKALK